MPHLANPEIDVVVPHRSLGLGGPSSTDGHELSERGRDDPDVDEADAGEFSVELVAGTRVLVQESVREEFTRLLAASMAKIPMGDPFDPQVLMGPLASRGHYEKVTGYIDLAHKEGGEIIGDPHDETDDLFVGPTLVTGSTTPHASPGKRSSAPSPSCCRSATWTKRCTSPTTPSSLAATVFTTDLSRAHTMADRLQAGTVWINTVNQMSSGPPAFGGFSSPASDGNTAPMSSMPTRRPRPSSSTSDALQGRTDCCHR